MTTRIAQALSKLFDRNRVVFWYDGKSELRGDFEGVELDGIEKVEIANNEFGLKHRILREQPNQKFLLYHQGPRPDDIQNWLLDVLLAGEEFRTDQNALWLAEIGLGHEFTDVVQAHTEFFQATKRREGLKRLVQADDTPSQLRLKMLAVCVGSEPRLDAVMEQLLADLAMGRDEKKKLVERSVLAPFLWEQLTRSFNYVSSEPGLRDFVLSLFKSCYALGTGGTPHMAGDALAFLKRWKDSRQFEESFERLSDECAEHLGIEKDLAERDFRSVLEIDYFRLIDRKVISELVHGVQNRTLPLNDVVAWVRQRRMSHWYGEFSHVYQAIEHAAMFLQALDEATLNMSSLADGVVLYTTHWFRLDQHYRKFIYHSVRAGQASLLGALAEQVENLYSNNFLLTLNDRWQQYVDSAAVWDAFPFPSQRQFFPKYVQPFLDKEVRICVIVSDAMRYEIGEELQNRIRQEDRYDATVEPMLSVIPSYTQLGMAALLPHQELALADGDTAQALVDGQSAQGLVNRGKILAAAIPDRSKTIKYEELSSLNKEETRALLRDNDVLYVYHNVIDARGDKRDTEDRVFDAAEEALDELVRLVKKLAGANVSNILVTADHGFIYQHRALEETDFADVPVTGDAVLFKNRRFVLGKGLAPSPSLRKFLSSEVGLTGIVEIQVPKSINRLRVQGAGSRFVHGGAALQEVVVPVVRVNKRRQSDVSVVDVEILRGASSVISSGQLAVTLFQSQAVTDKIQPRKLRAGIYTRSGELISDSHELTFDRTSENPREREMLVRFVLTRKADAANGQEVLLRLEEKLADTSHYSEYKSQRYTVRRSFTSDFDF